jgi:hypothetical protein
MFNTGWKSPSGKDDEFDRMMLHYCALSLIILKDLTIIAVALAVVLSFVAAFIF